MPTPYPAANFHTENITQFAADVDKASAGKKLLATLNGTFWAGFILTAILVIVLALILRA